jgi:GNAT superfamily N-acetyltransferase
MTKAQAALELRPATIADGEKVADLETARTPDEPRDPEMLHFRWTSPPVGEVFTRMMAERDGSAIAFLYAGHMPWGKIPERFGSMRFLLHPKIWSDTQYEQLIEAGEVWMRAEGGEIGVVRVRASINNDIRMLERRGYREVRRGRQWELDLIAHRARLLAGAVEGREHMRKQGVRVLTLDQDTDPDRLTKLYEMSSMGEQDIPTTVPMHTMSYEEWRRLWFDNPGTRTDRFWIAREGDAIVGLSAIEYPPTRGVPWTAFTTTARSVRGRGIARALKYETIAQAIGLGMERIRTQNDGENAPILHLNAQMGYLPIDPVLEMHRELGS